MCKVFKKGCIDFHSCCYKQLEPIKTLCLHFHIFYTFLCRFHLSCAYPVSLFCVRMWIDEGVCFSLLISKQPSLNTCT